MTTTTPFISDAQAYNLAAAVLARPECQGLVAAAREELGPVLRAAGFEPGTPLPVLTGEAYRGCMQVAVLPAYDPGRQASVEVRCVLYVHTVESSRSKAQLYFDAAVCDNPRSAGSALAGRQLAQVDLHEVAPAAADERATWFGKDFSRAVRRVVETFEADAASLFFADNAQALVDSLDLALAH